ncbi:glycoside hydrolase family 99-like domain-containing protein [Chroococcidiopsis sp. FACHB-1243]|uniref:glycoside hydrolase family 99-like domain-containing protein n=1 Tax=Chroococcidiopsis sp. [FACHB-1243] TaxID=2692781 RepID=UPI00178699F7|nr:glycoside hydrolase family 99-like domain-containing protein [Chroococcidiopsis sp. [FACHB-1243]]MBD2305771.1 glycoside hydrolase family 99-like domain-containing protein [Chroococcidiopsis sp. [FACHB-1243]]
MQARLIAFYLPQYHPIPENDEWWGKGFTEWTNVTKAKPLFSEHYQPHLPADLGFYDLRLSETRQAQADLAKEYGIYGFCYYHYWFNGKRLLERPFNYVLNSGKPDFPFCLCWANENWTRRWDGKEQNLLFKQVYSEEDDRLHMQWLAKAFSDRRYIKVDNKPLFLVYRATKLPNPKQTVKIWREEAKRLGVGEIFLCRVESFANEREDPGLIGFDASVEFQPDWTQLGLPLQKGRLWHLARKLGLAHQAYGNHNIYEYSTVVKHMLAKSNPTYQRFPCVTPSWDNTARRQAGAIIFQNSTPQVYESWLRTIVDKTLVNNCSTEKIVFINAWNEWAEGNHLEPCQKWGHAYLEATRMALRDRKTDFTTYLSRETCLK